MHSYDKTFVIDGRQIGESCPAYFIADIAANHDGDLSRAKDLIFLAAEAGADAAKFQHFKANTIVSDLGFRRLGGKKSHQAGWSKSVFDVYKDASVPNDWTIELVDTCKRAGVSFFTSPYAFDIVDDIDPYVPAYKIGSGDITWLEMVEHIARKKKPLILASGASGMEEVQSAVAVALRHNEKFSLLQCNTNYTAETENFKYIQLNVLKSYQAMYPGMILGLSDHTPGHTTVLGAVTLGAKIIEKHFTDDISRSGPDHKFSMTLSTWRAMVDATRELEYAMGNGIKKIEENERDTAVVQRRSIRLAKAKKAGDILSRADLDVLRPCPADAISPAQITDVVGKSLMEDKASGEYLRWIDLA